MEWYKEPDLSVLHPLSDTVPRALLDASDESGIIDNAVEDLPALQRVQAGHGGRRVYVLRHRARARVAHAASLAQAVRGGCKDNMELFCAVRVSGRAHMECLAGSEWVVVGGARIRKVA